MSLYLIKITICIPYVAYQEKKKSKMKQVMSITPPHPQYCISCIFDLHTEGLVELLKERKQSWEPSGKTMLFRHS